MVGTDSDKVRELMRECYGPYNWNHDKLMFMNVRSAELTKYAANAMLATKISFMNEMANLAERLGADIEDVRLWIGSHTVRALGYEADLLGAVENINERGRRPPCSASSAPLWTATCGARPSPSGGWPSSPTPMTCARPPAVP